MIKATQKQINSRITDAIDAKQTIKVTFKTIVSDEQIAAAVREVMETCTVRDYEFQIVNNIAILRDRTYEGVITSCVNGYCTMNTKEGYKSFYLENVTSIVCGGFTYSK